MKNQVLRSHLPVSFLLTGGSVRANALTFRSSDSTLTFRGKVHVHLIKKAKEEKAPPKPAAEALPIVPPMPEATGAQSESTGAVPVGTQ
jgi:zona occludens toxin (predicted ATPase)